MPHSRPVGKIRANKAITDWHCGPDFRGNLTSPFAVAAISLVHRNEEFVMSKEFSIVRGRNLNHLIMDAHGAQIGDARKGRRCFNVFLQGVYFGLNQSPNRRSGSAGASVKRLKDVPDFVAKTMAVVASLDAKAAAQKRVLLGDQVAVDVNQVNGSALSWLVAKALKVEVDLDYRGYYVAIVNRSSFDPLSDLEFVIDLMQKHIRSVSNLFTEQWEAVTFGSGTVGIGNSIPLACLRAFTANELGQQVMVHQCLFNA